MRPWQGIGVGYLTLGLSPSVAPRHQGWAWGEEGGQRSQYLTHNPLP